MKFLVLVKCLNNYWIDCHDILYRHSWSPEDEFSHDPQLYLVFIAHREPVQNWNVQILFQEVQNLIQNPTDICKTALELSPTHQYVVLFASYV